MIEDVKIKIYDNKKYGIPWILWKKFENTFFSMHISTFETIFDLGKNTMGGKVP